MLSGIEKSNLSFFFCFDEEDVLSRILLVFLLFNENIDVIDDFGELE